MPFTALTATQAANKSHAEDSRRRKPSALKQASDLQFLVYEATMALTATDPASEEAETRARIVQAVASGAKGWQSLNEQIRTMQGRGKPKSVPAANDPSLKARKPRAPIAPITPA